MKTTQWLDEKQQYALKLYKGFDMADTQATTKTYSWNTHSSSTICRMWGEVYFVIYVIFWSYLYRSQR